MRSPGAGMGITRKGGPNLLDRFARVTSHLARVWRRFAARVLPRLVQEVYARGATALRNAGYPVRDVAVWSATALFIVAVAAAGLWASNTAQRREVELTTQQKTALVARRLTDWVAWREAALTGVGAVGRGFTQIADQAYLNRALPGMVAAGWWDFTGRDGGVLVPAVQGDEAWILDVLKAHAAVKQRRVQLAPVDLPSGARGLLFIAPEAKGDAPWETVLGAAFELDGLFAATILDAPDLAEAVVQVEDAAGRLLFSSGDLSSPEHLVSVATVEMGRTESWQVRTALRPTRRRQVSARVDDMLFWLAVFGAGMFGMSGMLLTRQRQANMRTLRDLALAGERHRRSLEASSDAVLIADSAGQILWTNRAAGPMFGLPVEELVGRQWNHYLPHELGADHWMGVSTTPWPPRNMLPGQVACWDARRATGESFPVEVLITAFRGGERDKGTVITAFIRDVSGRVQLEARMQQSERLEALGRLAGGVAHDFNNILAGIGPRVELLRSKGLTAPQRAANLASLEEAVAAASGLVDQLLTVARTRQSAPTAVDLNACVERYLALVRDAQCAHTRVEVDFAADLPDVGGHQTQLGQVVTNLCVNAAQATPAGGTITLRTYPVDDGRVVVLEVRDTGSGIAPEHLAHIFEPFYTTKNANGGTGLGLATVYGIVRAHGGDITVVSQRGEGTTFTVRLPRFDPEAEMATVDLAS